MAAKLSENMSKLIHQMYHRGTANYSHKSIITSTTLKRVTTQFNHKEECLTKKLMSQPIAGFLRKE